MGRAVYVYGLSVDNGRNPAERHGGVIQSDRPLNLSRLTSVIIQAEPEILAGSVLRDFVYTEWRLDGDGYDPNRGQ